MASPELPGFPGGIRRPEDFGARLDDPQDYADLDELLGAADREGVLDVPAESAAPALDGEANRVREPVVADRLRMLGYLAQDDAEAFLERGTRRRAVLDAAGRFQAAAGLKRDRWVGEKTWAALQELVTFEAPTRVAAWFDGGRPRPALLRAVRLRLRALSFLDDDPRGGLASDTVPRQALQRFWAMQQRLSAAPADAPQPPLAELLALLFDQDRLVQAVAASTGERNFLGRRRIFVYRRDGPGEDAETKEAVRRYIVSLAKIELWLLDFDVDISASVDHRVFGLNPRGGFVPRDRKLHDALGAFWEAFREHIPIKKSWFEGHVTPELMSVLATAQDAPPAAAAAHAAAAEGDHSRAVSDSVGSEGEVRKAWTEGKSLGARLWDGLARIWRWIRRGVRRVLEVGRNLFRAFYRYALKGFQIVRFAARTVAAAFQQYTSGVVRVSEDDGIRLGVQGDGDFVVVVPADAAVEQVLAAGRAVRYFADAFRFSVRLLVVVMRLLKSTVLGFGGWLRLLWVLVRGYADLRPLYRRLRDLERQSGVPRLFEQAPAAV